MERLTKKSLDTFATGVEAALQSTLRPDLSNEASVALSRAGLRELVAEVRRLRGFVTRLPVAVFSGEDCPLCGGECGSAPRKDRLCTEGCPWAELEAEALAIAALKATA